MVPLLEGEFISVIFCSLLINLFLFHSEKTTKLASKPSVVTVSPWDGKDAVLQTDEIPLSELFGEDEL